MMAAAKKLESDFTNRVTCPRRMGLTGEPLCLLLPVSGQMVRLHPEYRPYVEMFLHEAALPTSADIASRKRTCPDVSCLKTAPIHNMKTENMFAHSSYAEQSTRAEHHRLRGLSLSKASGTFALQGKMRSNRKKRFRAMAKRSKVMLSDWVEHHKSDDAFLGLFNEKKISIARRHEIILKAMSGRRDNCYQST